jgi:hypothetical protein
MLRQWLITFASDEKVQILLLLLVADFILGVGAAFKQGTFRLSYTADILKRDFLGKVLPYFGVYVLALVQGHENLVIPGLDFGLFAGAAYALAVAAMVGSILNSLAGLGLKLPATIAGDENADTTGNKAPAIT